MSVPALLSIGVVVFSLTLAGLLTTMREFQKGEDPSIKKDNSINAG
tara:strand:+ start:155 stop:292 length:138 start_codon:yes stop_codon:yes gene_type:complete